MMSRYRYKWISGSIPSATIILLIIVGFCNERGSGESAADISKPSTEPFRRSSLAVKFSTEPFRAHSTTKGFIPPDKSSTVSGVLSASFTRGLPGRSSTPGLASTQGSSTPGIVKSTKSSISNLSSLSSVSSKDNSALSTASIIQQNFTIISQSTTLKIASTLAPDKSLLVEIEMQTPYNASVLDDVIDQGEDDHLELIQSVSDITNISTHRLSLKQLQHGSKNGTLVMQFLMEKGNDPRAIEAATFLQEEFNNNTLVLVDFYNNSLYPVNFNFKPTGEENYCGCTENSCKKGQCKCDSDGSFHCECSGSKCGKDQPWKVPIIIVIVLVVAFTIIIITAIICVRRCQMNEENKSDVVAGVREKKSHKKRNLIHSTAGATGTCKGSVNADSIVFTVLEEGPVREKREQSVFEAGSLPRSGAYRSVVAVTTNKGGTARGTAFNQQSFRDKDRIRTAASKLSHQY